MIRTLTDMILTVFLNTLRPRQNGRHFSDDIFKRIFLNKNECILIKISLKFVPKGPINNIPALVQIMVWCPPGDKPLSEPMMVRLPKHICITRPHWVNQDHLDSLVPGRCGRNLKNMIFKLILQINNHKYYTRKLLWCEYDRTHWCQHWFR